MMSNKAIGTGWLITAILVVIIFIVLLLFLRNSQLPFVEQIKGIISDLKEPSFFAKEAIPDDVLNQQGSKIPLDKETLNSGGL